MAGPPGSTVLGGVKPRPAPVPRKLQGILASPGRLILGRFGLDGRNSTHIFGSLRMPRIVGGLHPGPDSCAVAKELAEPNRDGRRYRLLFLQDVVEMLARNPEQSGDFRLSAAGGRNNVIAKQRSGVSRTTAFAALCRIDHACSFNGTARNRPDRLRHPRIRRGCTTVHCRGPNNASDLPLARNESRSPEHALPRREGRSLAARPLR